MSVQRLPNLHNTRLLVPVIFLGGGCFGGSTPSSSTVRPLDVFLKAINLRYRPPCWSERKVRVMCHRRDHTRFPATVRSVRCR
jgi:hypothetical protein